MSESKADTHLPLHYIFMNAIVSQFAFKSISAAASCGPAPRPQINTLFLNGVACSVCTVDLASCSNVMQCKENFCSLTGLPLNFPERIHPVPFVSQAKDFLFYRWIVCQKNRERINPLPVKSTICIQLEWLIMPAGQQQRVLYQLHFPHI